MDGCDDVDAGTDSEADIAVVANMQIVVVTVREGRTLHEQQQQAKDGSQRQ